MWGHACTCFLNSQHSSSVFSPILQHIPPPNHNATFCASFRAFRFRQHCICTVKGIWHRVKLRKPLPNNKKKQFGFLILLRILTNIESQVTGSLAACLTSPGQNFFTSDRFFPALEVKKLSFLLVLNHAGTLILPPGLQALILSCYTQQFFLSPDYSFFWYLKSFL